MSQISDDIYQYRRNYVAHVTAEYQFRTDESPCYELKTLENSISPLSQSQARSFEQATTSKIRDLNTELSHSRQLKAAAVAAAAISTNIKDVRLYLASKIFSNIRTSCPSELNVLFTIDSLKIFNELVNLLIGHRVLTYNHAFIVRR
jgi:hypothetical protein